jgi:3-hydroxy-9,10-secoandrosta-1,3,5(10)-triene-9,17-dione monooxygenase reductase component
VLDGTLTWAACTVENVHDGGDHHVVIGRITELGDVTTGEPLLFYRGRYGLTDDLPLWPRDGDWILARNHPRGRYAPR